VRSRSGLYRRQDGEERLWYQPSDIERMMEDALRNSMCLASEESPATDIERFIGSVGARMDQHADLEPDVLGLTEFHKGSAPKIFINRDLTGAIDDDDTPPGIRGRWRATMAHEASHVVMHRILFELNEGQAALFSIEPQPPKQLMRCLKKNVLFRGRASDWREVQANMGMAALLMPQGLFRAVVGHTVTNLNLHADGLIAGSPAAVKLTAEIATLFDVSRRAAGIRLETMGLLSPSRQPWLISGNGHRNFLSALLTSRRTRRIVRNKAFQSGK
jgi:IrrE N-terminal-like domain